MKLEIDLDLQKIDYDAINKQIQDKVAALNLEDVYQFDSKIKSKIDEEVKVKVGKYFSDYYWIDLNDKSKEQIRKIITDKIKEITNPHIEELLNQISKEELEDIIIQILPMVLTDQVASLMKNALSNFYWSTTSSVVQQTENRIRNMLGR